MNRRWRRLLAALLGALLLSLPLLFLYLPTVEAPLLSLSLQPPVIEPPRAARGTVVDAYTGSPVVSATVALPFLTVESGSRGEFEVEGIAAGTVAQVVAQGYEPVTAPLVPGENRIALRPTVLSGAVRDKVANTPVPDATVFLGDRSVKTDSNGAYRFDEVPANPRLVVLATGYALERVEVGRTVTKDVALQPLVVKGIYLTFYTLGWEQRREELLALIDRTELNAVVIDVKSDMGLVNAGVGVPLSRQIGAEVTLLDDLPALVGRLKAKGVYTIARVVVFKDNRLAQAKPELAVRDGRGIYIDCEDQRWTDPYSKAIWNYNLSIAEAAARAGFDEVQFDYIRFPSDCVRDSLTYSQPSSEQTRLKAIEGFLAAASQRLRPLGVFVGADTFGWITIREDDMGIGQLIEGMAQHIDYLSPMVYPSTWGPGSLGILYPPAQPYSIVYQSLERAVTRTKDIPTVRVRPWLQDFSDYGPLKLEYGPAQVQAQIKAAKDAGTLGWMLWDPFVKYSRGALQPR